MSHYAEYRTHDLEQLFTLVSSYPLGDLSKNNPKTGVPDTVSVPFLFDRENQNLEFHMARGNPAFDNIASGGKVSVTFTGPNGHISPAWYKTRFKDTNRSRTAPTWNYIKAKFTGTLQPAENTVLTEHLRKLVKKSEDADNGWDFSEIDSQALQSWTQDIACFRISIDTAEAIFKLSQEQEPADQQHIITALRNRALPFDRPLADLMEQYLKT